MTCCANPEVEEWTQKAFTKTVFKRCVGCGFYVCSMSNTCSFKTCQPRVMKAHILKKHQDYEVICFICKKIFNNKRLYKRHRQEHLQNALEEQIPGGVLDL